MLNAQHPTFAPTENVKTAPVFSLPKTVMMGILVPGRLAVRTTATPPPENAWSSQHSIAMTVTSAQMIFVMRAADAHIHLTAISAMMMTHAHIRITVRKAYVWENQDPATTNAVKSRVKKPS